MILLSLAHLEPCISVRLLAGKAHTEFGKAGWVLQAAERYKRHIMFSF